MTEESTMGNQPRDPRATGAGEKFSRGRSGEKAPRPVAPVLEKMYQLLLWLIPTVDKFPKSQKFLRRYEFAARAIDKIGRMVDCPSKAGCTQEA